jgi:hypothetical protein
VGPENRRLVTTIVVYPRMWAPVNLRLLTTLSVKGSHAGDHLRAEGLKLVMMDTCHTLIHEARKYL